MSRSKRSFSLEFREKAVSYVVEQRKPIALAARELGIGESTLGNWVSATRNRGSANPSQMNLVERDELRVLRAKNRELEMRVELLKKAVTFVCPEHGIGSG